MKIFEFIGKVVTGIVSVIFACIGIAMFLVLFGLAVATVSIFVGWTWAFIITIPLCLILGGSSAVSGSGGGFYRTFWTRKMGEPAQMWTEVDTPTGTSVNQYSAAPEQAVVITKEQK